MKKKIDFIITWVDGNDEKWLKERNQYTNKNETPKLKNRYKDWGLLKYWFRGVEKFAPWVNKIYFITYGHLPEWLNTNNPKIVIVKHKDYIPEYYLPTYNSNVIELNINRIKSLSEKFVLFNDDTLIIRKTKEDDFFDGDKPKDTIGLNVHCPQRSRMIQSISNNDVSIINDYFDFKESIKLNYKKWLNPKNGKGLLRTLMLIKCPRFPGFYQTHLPASHRKSYFQKMWDLEGELMNATSLHRFRKQSDINHWLIKEWYIAEGNVSVRSDKFGKVFHLEGKNDKKNISRLINYIEKQKGKIVCINDTEMTNDEYEKNIHRIIDSLNKIMPNKSSFEK